MLKLNAAGDSNKIASSIFDTGSATFTKGMFGDYHDKLTQRQYKKLIRYGKSCIKNFGYDHLLCSDFVAFTEKKEPKKYLSKYTDMFLNKKIKVHEKEPEEPMRVAQIDQYNIVEHLGIFYAVNRMKGDYDWLNDETVENASNLNVLFSKIKFYDLREGGTQFLEHGKRYNLLKYRKIYYIVPHKFGQVSSRILSNLEMHPQIGIHIDEFSARKAFKHVDG